MKEQNTKYCRLEKACVCIIWYFALALFGGLKQILKKKKIFYFVCHLIGYFCNLSLISICDSICLDKGWSPHHAQASCPLHWHPLHLLHPLMLLLLSQGTRTEEVHPAQHM